jgi:hypothetical protein
MTPRNHYMAYVYPRPGAHHHSLLVAEEKRKEKKRRVRRIFIDHSELRTRLIRESCAVHLPVHTLSSVVVDDVEPPQALDRHPLVLLQLEQADRLVEGTSLISCPQMSPANVPRNAVPSNSASL